MQKKKSNSCYSRSWKRGAERQLIELLKDPSHKLLIFKTAGECKKELDANKINYKELNLNNSLHFFANFLKISEEIKLNINYTRVTYNACLIVSPIKLFLIYRIL